MDDNRFPKRRHLKRLERVYKSATPEIYFITVCNHCRRPFLVQDGVFKILLAGLREAAEKSEWLIGRFVVMPDHIHFFCAPQRESADLSELVRLFKGSCSRRLHQKGFRGQVWQSEFFDHLLRSSESYPGKWEYVRLNPVRKGLCEKPEEWKHQGEIAPLER